MYDSIYENGVNNLGQYFTLISQRQKAASEPCKREKIEKGEQERADKRLEEIKRLTLPLIFMSSGFREKKTPGEKT